MSTGPGRTQWTRRIKGLFDKRVGACPSAWQSAEAATALDAAGTYASDMIGCVPPDPTARRIFLA